MWYHVVYLQSTIWATLGFENATLQNRCVQTSSGYDLIVMIHETRLCCGTKVCPDVASLYVVAKKAASHNLRR